MDGPISGIRVIEITTFHQGPTAGSLLGDMGADVIKVEPKAGDPGRGFMRVIGVMQNIKGRNHFFEACNRSKRSIVLDLKKKKGLEIFLKLIDSADVFLTNLSIDAPYRMGINYEALSARNPGLIYAHVSGWGREGADANAPCYDYVGLARAGTMMMCGEEGAPPQNIVPGLADYLGGVMGAFSVCAALYAREKTGKGQLVDTSQFGAMINLETTTLAAACMHGQEYPRPVRAKARNPLYNHYKCRDGKWIAIALLQPDRGWSTFCKVTGLEELEHDPRFENLEVRGEHAAEMVSILDEKFATRTREEWMDIFKGADLIYAPVQSALEVAGDPQAMANDYFVWFDHPVFGRTKTIGFPWMFHGTPASIKREAPELGQHTEEILLELGFNWDDISSLKSEEVIP